MNHAAQDPPRLPAFATVDRRRFLQLGGIGAVALGVGPLLGRSGLGTGHAAATAAATAGRNLLPATVADTSTGVWAFIGVAAGGPTPVLTNRPASTGFGGHSIAATVSSKARLSVVNRNPVKITAGKVYSALCSVKTPRAGSASAQITWYNAAGQYLSYSDGTNTSTTAGGVTDLRMSATAPTGAASAAVAMNLKSTANAAEVIEVGLFELAPGTPIDTWTNGTGTAVQPSGTGFLRLQDADPGGSVVSGRWQFSAAVPSLQAALNTCQSGQILSLPPACIVPISGFGKGYYNGIRIGSGDGKTCGGIQGTDLTTVVEVIAYSTTAEQRDAGNVTTGSNPLYILALCGVSATPLVAPVLKHFTLHGTPQDTNYGGILLEYCRQAVLYGLALKGASPGSASVPPGETFGIGINHSPDCLVSHTEVDGRDDNGTPICAAPIGWNRTTNTAGAILLDEVYLHHSKYSGLTFFETQNITTRSIRCEYNGGGGINHEQSNGRIRHIAATLIVNFSWTGNVAQHMNLQNVTADMTDVQVTLKAYDYTEPACNGAFSVMIGDNYQYGAGTHQMVTTLPRISLVGSATPLTPYDANTSTSGCTPTAGWVRYH